MICRRITITNQPGDATEYARTLPALHISENDMENNSIRIKTLKKLICSELIKFGYNGTVDGFSLLINGGFKLSDDGLLEKSYVEGTYMLYGNENINPIRIVSSGHYNCGFVTNNVLGFWMVSKNLENYWAQQDVAMRPQYICPK